MTSTPALTVGNVTIHQRNGLFSLNDLHTAAGGEAKHQPALFVRLESTQALIKEIHSTDSQSAAINTINGGKHRGTYACRELVIAYASWINAEFQLKVIRVFLDTQAPQRTPYSVQQGQSLTAEEAETLRLMLKTAVEQLPKQKQGHAMMEGWSKLKSHFKVSYRDIPRSEYPEAVSLLSRHISGLPSPAPQQPELAFDPTDAAQMQSARQAALDYFNKARAALKTGGAWPEPDDLENILRGLLANALCARQWLVHFSPQSHISLSPAKRNTLGELAQRITSGDIPASNEELLQLGAACREKLMKRLSLPPTKPAQ